MGLSRAQHAIAIRPPEQRWKLAEAHIPACRELLDQRRNGKQAPASDQGVELRAQGQERVQVHQRERRVEGAGHHRARVAGPDPAQALRDAFAGQKSSWVLGKAVSGTARARAISGPGRAIGAL